MDNQRYVLRTEFGDFNIKRFDDIIRYSMRVGNQAPMKPLNDKLEATLYSGMQIVPCVCMYSLVGKNHRLVYCEYNGTKEPMSVNDEFHKEITGVVSFLRQLKDYHLSTDIEDFHPNLKEEWTIMLRYLNLIKLPDDELAYRRQFGSKLLPSDHVCWEFQARYVLLLNFVRDAFEKKMKTVVATSDDDISDERSSDRPWRNHQPLLGNTIRELNLIISRVEENNKIDMTKTMYYYTLFQELEDECRLIVERANIPKEPTTEHAFTLLEAIEIASIRVAFRGARLKRDRKEGANHSFVVDKSSVNKTDTTKSGLDSSRELMISLVEPGTASLPSSSSSIAVTEMKQVDIIEICLSGDRALRLNQGRANEMGEEKRFVCKYLLSECENRDDFKNVIVYRKEEENLIGLCKSKSEIELISREPKMYRIHLNGKARSGPEETTMSEALLVSFKSDSTMFVANMTPLTVLEVFGNDGFEAMEEYITNVNGEIDFGEQLIKVRDYIFELGTSVDEVISLLMDN